MDMVPLIPNTAARSDLHSHGAADHVSGREVFCIRGVTFHEPLAITICQESSFPASTFSNEAAGAIDTGRMELDKFHIL